MLVPLAKFEDPDNSIGWRTLPVLGVHPAVAYLTVSDSVELKTEDPEALDVLSEKAARAAHALRLVRDGRSCDLCEDRVLVLYEKVIPAGDGDTQTVLACEACCNPGYGADLEVA